MNACSSADGTGLRSERFFYNLLPAVDIYTVKADYTHPLPRKALLEMGAKSSIVLNDDDAQHFDIEGNNFLPDYSGQIISYTKSRYMLLILMQKNVEENRSSARCAGRTYKAAG